MEFKDNQKNWHLLRRFERAEGAPVLWVRPIFDAKNALKNYPFESTAVPLTEKEKA